MPFEPAGGSVNPRLLAAGSGVRVLATSREPLGSPGEAVWRIPPMGVVAPPGGWPSIGSVMTKLCAASAREVPPFVGLAPNAGHPPYGSPGHPGFLGPSYSAFRPNGAGMSDLVLNGVTSDRLAE